MSNAETASVHPIVRTQIDTLDAMRGLMHKLVDDLSEEQMLHRTCPGGNHPMWCVGHIAATEQFILGTCAGGPRVLPEAWDALFTMESKPSDDPGVYPSKADLMSRTDALREKVVGWLGVLDEAALRTPIPGDLASFIPSFAQIGGSLVAHESFHLGQISAARRAIGLPPLF